jgi:hypothetical protein
MVNDDDLDRHLPGFELESQLFLQRAEYRRARSGFRRLHCRQPRFCDERAIGCVLEREVKLPFDPCLVGPSYEDRAPASWITSPKRSVSRA